MNDTCAICEFYEWSEPVARKQHVCVECLAPILAGEKHFRYAGKWEGDFDSGRQHLLCMQACMFIRDNLNGGDCICFGGLKEWLSDARYQVEKQNPYWKELRHMVAKIKWRERGADLTP